MGNRTKLAFIFRFVACCAPLYGCESKAPRQLAPAPSSQPATSPAPPRIASPPELTGDPSLCVVRHFELGDEAWTVQRYPYDPAKRVLGEDWMHFDASGRLTKRDSNETQTYDDHGNPKEWRRAEYDGLRDGTYWDNRYEGDPPRLVEQALGKIVKPNRRKPPHKRIRFEYARSGKLVEEHVTGPQPFVRRFTWEGERIVSIQGRQPAGKEHETCLTYYEGQTFEYDAQLRLTAYARDGATPFGENPCADGKPDQRESFFYDEAGRLARIERDGMVGDVAPEDPDGKPDEITLLSPPCDPLVRLAPRLFGFPQLFLPESIEPPLR